MSDDGNKVLVLGDSYECKNLRLGDKLVDKDGDEQAETLILDFGWATKFPGHEVVTIAKQELSDVRRVYHLTPAEIMALAVKYCGAEEPTPDKTKKLRCWNG